VKARGRPVPGTMNGTEAAYAALLEAKRRAGQVRHVGFETIKLILADRTTYTPDFVVLDAEGLLEFHEVKGFMRDDARVKLKVAARLFPWCTFRLIRKEKTRWTSEEVSA
jgi:hypothetical protein